MATTVGYRLTVSRGARQGLVKLYAADKGRVARRFADKLDLEYGACCATVSLILDVDNDPSFTAR